MSNIHGIFPPMLTMFDEEGNFNEEAQRKHTNFLIENGIHGLIPTGSTGEFIAMTLEERKKVVEVVVDEADGRVPVYAGTGHYSTDFTIELSRHAEQVGADGVMIITPYYLPRSEGEIYEHYRLVSEAIDIPIMLYHNPHFSNVTLTDDFIQRCWEDGIIASVKEGEGEVYRINDLRYRCGENLGIFYGFDQCPLESFMMGADGWVAGTANLLPKEISLIYEYAQVDIEKAKEQWYRIKPYIDFITNVEDGKWLHLLKAGLEMRGEQKTYPRKPAVSIEDELLNRLRKILEELAVV